MNSFAAVLHRNMGEAAWTRLHRHIRERFAAHSGAILRFRGVMERVHCSPAGALIARVLRAVHVLPATHGADVPFDFSIAPVPGGFSKLRHYHFAGAEVFAFGSVFNDVPALHEEFPGGLGMYLELKEEDGALIFRDKGYFLRCGRWRLPLPRLLSVGAFELLHRNIDRERFQVLIRIHHPLLGTLFYQRGEFSAAPEVKANPRAAESRAARSADIALA